MSRLGHTAPILAPKQRCDRITRSVDTYRTSGDEISLLRPKNAGICKSKIIDTVLNT